MGQDMLKSGHVRIIRATNATKPDVLERIAQIATTDAGVSCGMSTYQSTGAQTQPLRDALQFREIFGRSPLHGEIGTAAIGRYTPNGGASTYELKYGEPFLSTRAGPDKPKYVDSSFQTTNCPETVRMITKAKVKATMMVGKYRKVAEEAGFKVFAESNIEKVIHSEQFPTLVTLDADGNTKDGDLGPLFIPNIYGERIVPETPQNHPDPRVPRPAMKECSSQHAIASLTPSLRKDVPNPKPTEDYGGYTETKQREEDHAESMNDAYGRDNVLPQSFVVYDPACYPSPITPTATPKGSPSSNKRKRVAEDEPTAAEASSKRARRSSSPTRTKSDCKKAAKEEAKPATREAQPMKEKSNSTNKSEAPMAQAPLAADRALAHNNTEPARVPKVLAEVKASSRVEKGYKEPVEHGAKRETAARLNDDKEKKKKGSAPVERKPPSGRRPRRDARSLINRWLGA